MGRLMVVMVVMMLMPTVGMIMMMIPLTQSSWHKSPAQPVKLPTFPIVIIQRALILPPPPHTWP